MVERPTLRTLLSKKGANGALFIMGEVLFITRPLIYVLFIRKYGIRSWIPWFLSLAVDFTGLGFVSLATRSRHVRKEHEFHLSMSEKDEVRVPLIITCKFLITAGSSVLFVNLGGLLFRDILLAILIVGW